MANPSPKQKEPTTIWSTEYEKNKINQAIVENMFITALNSLVLKCHAQAVEMGWYTDLETGQRKVMNPGERIALMHSELSEMLEGVRKPGRSEHIKSFSAEEEEFVDLLIRAFDYAGDRNISVGHALIAKLNFNRNRADHQIENRKNDGKQF